MELTGFDFDFWNNQVVTGFVTYDPSCAQQVGAKSFTFISLFDNHDTAQIYQKTPLQESLFSNPLIKPNNLLFLNKRDNNKLNLVSIGLSSKDQREYSLDFSRSAYLVETDHIITYHQLILNPTDNENILLATLKVNHHDYENYVLYFDDTYSTRRLLKLKAFAGIQNLEFVSAACTSDISLLLNLKYIDTQNSNQIYHSLIKQSISTAIHNSYGFTQKIHDINGFNSKILPSQKDQKLSYLVYSSHYKNKISTTIAFGYDDYISLKLVQLLDIPFAFENFDFIEINHKILFLNGLQTNLNNQGMHFSPDLTILDVVEKMSYIINMEDSTSPKLMLLTFKETFNLKNSMIFLQGHQTILLSHGQVIVSNTFNAFESQKIIINKLSQQILNKDENLIPFINDMEQIQLKQKTSDFNEVHSLILLDSIYDTTQEKPIHDSIVSQRRQLDVVYTLNDASSNVFTISIDNTPSSLTHDYLLELKGDGNPVAISEVTLGNDEVLPEPQLKFNDVTSTLEVKFSEIDLQLYTGTRTLNVKTLINTDQTTVAYIQVYVKMPDTVKNANVTNLTNIINACSATMNPYYFGDHINPNFGNTIVKYIHVDYRSWFFLAGEADAKPFHDGISTKKAGFFAYFQQNGVPFWIYRLQQDIPGSEQTDSSCYLLTDSPNYIYTICSVRNLQSTSLPEKRNILVKVARENGQLAFMKYIYAQATPIEQEVFYIKNLTETNKLILGLSYDTVNPKSYQLIKIDDSYPFKVDAHVTYTTSVESKIHMVYKQAKTIGDAFAESHLVFLQRSTSPPKIYDLKYDTLSITRGVELSSTLQSDKQCFGATSADSSYYFPCVIVDGSGSDNQKLYMFRLSLAGNELNPPAFKDLDKSYGIIIEIAGTNTAPLTEGQLVSHYSPSNSSNQVYFYGCSSTQFYIYNFNVDTFYNQTLHSWSYSTNLGPNSIFSLVRTYSNQPQTTRKYYGFVGKTDENAKYSTIVFTTGTNCMIFSSTSSQKLDYRQHINITSTDVNLRPNKFLTAIDSTSFPTMAVQDASIANTEFVDVLRYSVTTQSYQTDLSQYYQWGQGSMPLYFRTSTNFSTRLCGAYDYSNFTQDFQYLDINEGTSFEYSLVEPYQCQNRPRTLKYYSPQLTINDPIKQSSFVSIENVDGKQTLKITPGSNIPGQAFNLNLTYVDTYDGRIATEYSYMVRYNRNNPTNFPTQNYFKCGANIFPFSYGQQCASNCGLIVKGFLYDKPTDNLLLYGAVEMGFSLLKDNEKSGKTDSFIMRTNAYGIALWMNQYRYSVNHNEYPTAATVYNETYVMLAIKQLKDDGSTENYVFARFLYTTGQYNGTIQVSRINGIINSVMTPAFFDHIPSMISSPYTVDGITTHRILVSFHLKFTSDATKKQNGYFVMNPNNNIVTLDSRVLGFSQDISYEFTTQGPITQSGGSGFQTIQLDILSGTIPTVRQYLYIQRLDLDNGKYLPSGIANGRYLIGREQEEGKRILTRPPQIIPPENGILIAMAIVYQNMKIFAIDENTFEITKEANLTSTFVIQEYNIQRLPLNNEYVLLSSKGAAANYEDGLIIFILDSTFKPVRQYKTTVIPNTIPSVFTASKLTNANGLYYVYGAQKFAYDQNGNEVVVGFMNFNNKAIDENECISYKTVDTIELDHQDIQSLSTRSSLAYSNAGQYSIYDVFTPLVWQLQYGDTRLLLPKTLKTAVQPGVAINQQCTKLSPAIASPQNKILQSKSVTLLESSNAIELDVQSIFTNTLNCQGLPTTVKFVTTAETNWQYHNKFLTKTDNKLSIDVSTENIAPSIREVKVVQCMAPEYNNEICSLNYLPLEVKPSTSLAIYTERTYPGCTAFPNAYPKTLGDYNGNLMIQDSDYDPTNNKLVMCGQRDYIMFQDSEFQILKKNGIIVYYDTITEHILWSYSATQLTSSYSSTTSYGDTEFHACQIITENSQQYVYSLIYASEYKQITIIKQRSDGQYTQAYSFQEQFASTRAGLYIDKIDTGSDIYVYPTPQTSTKMQHIYKLQQYDRGFQLKWVRQTLTEGSYKFPIHSITRFNNQIFFSTQFASKTDFSSHTMFGSVNPLDGSSVTALKIYSKGGEQSKNHNTKLANDNQNLYFSSANFIDAYDASYTKTLMKYKIVNNVLQFDKGIKYTINSISGYESKMSLVVTNNLVIDAFHFVGLLSYIGIFQKATLSKSFIKVLSSSGSGLQFAKIGMNAAQTQIFLTLTTKGFLSTSLYSGVLHKFNSTLESENDCFFILNYNADLKDITQETSVSLSIEQESVPYSTKLWPATSLYLEAKLQYRDINFRVAKGFDCKPKGFEFFDDLEPVALEPNTTPVTIPFPTTDLCGVVDITVSVDLYQQLPSFIAVDYTQKKVTLTPSTTQEAGIYSLRFKYTYQTIQADRNMIINVKPAKIGAEVTLEDQAGCPSDPVLFHLHKEGPNYFMSGDMNSDSTIFVVCGHRMKYYQQAFYLQFNQNFKQEFQMDLGSGLWDSYMVDCKYDSSDDLYNMVNSYVSADRTKYAIYLYKFDKQGFYKTSKEIAQDSVNIYGDGIVLTTSQIIIYGRTGGLLGYSTLSPFILRMTTSLQIVIYKTINYPSGSIIKSLVLGNTDKELYAIMGTKDASKNDKKIWTTFSLDANTYYPRWAKKLTASPLISVYDFEDYGSPTIDYMNTLDAPFACVYYQAKYVSLTIYEAALIRINSATGAITKSLEWQTDQPIQSCEFNYLRIAERPVFSVVIGTSTKTYINQIEITFTDFKRLSTATKDKVFTLDFGLINTVRNRMRMKTNGNTIYIFSSNSYLSPISERIGRHFITTIDVTDVNDQLWNKPCEFSSFQGEYDFSENDLKEGNGYEFISQETNWESFDLTSKMVSSLYIDHFFYQNPSYINNQIIYAASEDFVDYRSIFGSGEESCSPYAKPTPPEDLLSFVGDDGLKVQLASMVITLPKFTQCQGYSIKHTVIALDEDEEEVDTLPPFFIYDQIQNRLIVQANENRYVGTYKFKLKAELEVDSEVSNFETFEIEILENLKPVFDTDLSDVDFTISERSQRDISVYLIPDPEADPQFFYEIALYDSTDQKVESPWFSITKYERNELRLQLPIYLTFLIPPPIQLRW